MHEIKLWAICMAFPEVSVRRIFVLISLSLEGSRIEGADHSISANKREKKCGRVGKFLVISIRASASPSCSETWHDFYSIILPTLEAKTVALVYFLFRYIVNILCFTMPFSFRAIWVTQNM